MATFPAHGTRLLPAGFRTGALSWAAGTVALVRISGSGAGSREYPSYLSAGPQKNAPKGQYALFFGGPTPFLLALSKEMGSEKIASQGRSPWYSPFSGAFLVSFCAYKKKLAARRDLAKIMNDLMRDHDV